MYFSPTYIIYNKINKFMEVYSLPCLKKKIMYSVTFLGEIYHLKYYLLI